MILRSFMPRMFIIGLALVLAQSCAGAGPNSKLRSQSISGSVSPSMEEMGQAVVRLACRRLDVQADDPDLACLTNIGSATVNGRSTRILFDILPKLADVSIGRGNLLAVHDRFGADPYFAFVSKKNNRALMMVLIHPAGQGVACTEAVNVRVDKGTSFKPFETVFGKKAFALVTLANGWADGIPEGLMTGSLYHDHLCCGVFSGYYTANYIRQHIPLTEGEKYIYIGAPAWCQDDYLITAMNLTPGKHGYYTMAYPWYRSWKTKEKTYDQLGGIVIRYNAATATGSAHVLRFDWHWREFLQSLDMPGLTLDWKAHPWLHVCYNRFSMEHLARPDYFVSVIRQTRLQSKKDLDRLISLGTNPLAQLLGPDATWQP